jgi:uncharacterized membrane protein YbhN (UPF0104 family)
VQRRREVISFLGGALRRAAGSGWGRALVSGAILAAVLLQVDLSHALERAGRAQWPWLVAGVGAFAGAVLLGAARWHLFLAAAGVARSFGQALAAFLAGAFAANLLPTSLGGDAVRGWLGSPPGSRTRAYASVLVDRVTVLGCALVLAWLALAGAGGMPVALVAALGGASGAYGAGLAAVLAAGLVAPRLGASAGRPGALAVEAWQAARGSLAGRLLARTTLLGFAYEALAVTSVWLLARSLAVDVSWPELAVVIPPVLILAALPVSIGGLGVREASYVGLLAPLGVSATEATLLGLVTGLVYALVTLPGALVLARRPRGAAVDAVG